MMKIIMKINFTENLNDLDSLRTYVYFSTENGKTLMVDE